MSEVFECKWSEPLENVVLSPGDAYFFIRKASLHDKYGEPLTTKDGNKKLGLQLEVTDKNGESAIVFDSISSKAGFKLRQVCHAVGRPDLYTKDKQAIDPVMLQGCEGKCVLAVDRTIEPERTVIKEYLFFDDEKVKISE